MVKLYLLLLLFIKINGETYKIDDLEVIYTYLS